ncbi:Uncharacterized protein BM_BM1064 [Brugia malayi]|uniref:Bm1064 n=1 Tax=Brugia malayi TaxID=6279 RepID=A0A0K0INY9_BRUMA|nr:Uncharacterized protein BM_BM1064 [Brugia malayi]CDP90646.1 Bm1064 [Brugia malayi]VIO87283.1 Uncharacterized protein BM_BM1064 [Brugia malayi]
MRDRSSCVKEIRCCRIRMLILLRTLKPAKFLNEPNGIMATDMIAFFHKSIDSIGRRVLKKVISKMIFTG